MTTYYGEPWRPGFGYGSIITDKTPDGQLARVDASYGGHFIGEGFARDLMLRACACVNALQGFDDTDLGNARALLLALSLDERVPFYCGDAETALAAWAERNGWVKVSPAPMPAQAGPSRDGAGGLA